MPKSKPNSHHDNRQSPATVYLPSTPSNGHRPTSSSSQRDNMYIRRSTLNFEDGKGEERGEVLMWDDDLPHTQAFTSEIVPYGIKASEFEPDNVHFKQHFNQKDLMNEKVDAWTNLAEEAKTHMKRKQKENVSENDIKKEENDLEETAKKVEIDITDTEESNVAIAESTVANRQDESCMSRLCCADFKHDDGVKCCKVQTGLPLPCFIVILILGLLIFPVTFFIAFVFVVICCPALKLVKACRSKDTQSRR
ncbi:uncharacterized protein [Antedon mediterranea]|uniref:uncharacterized protein n=1 Tax=Antedon mediterranea TaxID=105859 RepID=UPI003AF97D67